MTKPAVAFSAHAVRAMAERGLDARWVEQVVRSPQWATADPNDPSRELRYGPVPESDGRVLRVVCVADTMEVRVITAFFDRRARRPG